MRSFTARRHILFASLIIVLFIFSPCYAAITFDGDVSPAAPMFWSNTTDGYVGDTAPGSVEINGGDILDAKSTYIGDDYLVTGEVTVAGAGSTLSNSEDLHIGVQGIGVLDIDAGGVVTCQNAYIGQFSGFDSPKGTVNIDGAGSQWTVNAGLTVQAALGNAVLNLTNGGTFSASIVTSQSGGGLQLNINGGTFDVDNVTVKDGGQMKIVSDIRWKNYVALYQSGQMTSMGDVYVGYELAGGVFQHDTGSTHTIYGTLNVGGSGVPSAYLFDDGSLTVPTINLGVDGIGVLMWGGGTLDADTIHVGAGGAMDADAVETDNFWIHEGMLRIVDGGLVTSAREFTTQNAGVVNMSDGGVFALYGDADDSLSQFLGLVEGTDAIQWWDPAVGDWNSLTTATMGTDYTLEYQTGDAFNGYTLLTVYAIEPPPGDANLDGQVDASDATILAGNWQATGASWSMGDFNGDGSVDASDATILAGNWQAGTSANTVPEPSTVVLLFAAFLTVGSLVISRKRR
ncbi:MAG: dockerin type I domain-containing protein [Planctomycetia bacterium]|jgi:T5SS/PEP-CTERM-associated repeat protein